MLVGVLGQAQRGLEGQPPRRVIVVPGLAPVTGGPYRWFSHPNYVAVVVEEENREEPDLYGLFDWPEYMPAKIAILLNSTSGTAL